MKLSVRRFENMPPEELFLGLMLTFIVLLSFMKTTEGFEHGSAADKRKKMTAGAIAAAETTHMVATPPESFSLYR